MPGRPGGDSLPDVSQSMPRAASIQVKEPPLKGAKGGPLAKLHGDSEFGYQVAQYPLSLGEGTRNPYYMTFFINTQHNSSFKSGIANSAPPPRSAFDRNAGVSRNHTESTKVTNGIEFGFGRKTTRTAKAIRIYMPDTLSWNYAHNFKDATFTGVQGAIMGAVSSAASAMQGGAKNGGGITGALKAIPLKEIAGKVGGAILEDIAGSVVDMDLVRSGFGLALNPQISVIYESPTLRSFSFEFMFAPRSEQEAEQVLDIIQTFKFHAAPEIPTDALLGRYIIPPSEFDIEFSVGTMGKISTCVLEDIAIDYGSSGAAFYRDGKPVYTRLNLKFKELEFVSKQMIQNGGY